MTGFEDFELEATSLFGHILLEAGGEDYHPYSVVKACLDVILFVGRSLPLEDRRKLADLLFERIESFVIEEYNEER